LWSAAALYVRAVYVDPGWLALGGGTDAHAARLTALPRLVCALGEPACRSCLKNIRALAGFITRDDGDGDVFVHQVRGRSTHPVVTAPGVAPLHAGLLYSGHDPRGYWMASGGSPTRSRRVHPSLLYTPRRLAAADEAARAGRGDSPIFTPRASAPCARARRWSSPSRRPRTAAPRPSACRAPRAPSCRYARRLAATIPS
jgi:hypothetical protein